MTEMIHGRKYASLTPQEKTDVLVLGRMAKLGMANSGGNHWVFFDTHAHNSVDGLRYTLRLPTPGGGEPATKAGGGGGGAAWQNLKMSSFSRHFTAV